MVLSPMIKMKQDKTKKYLWHCAPSSSPSFCELGCRSHDDFLQGPRNFKILIFPGTGTLIFGKKRNKNKTFINSCKVLGWKSLAKKLTLKEDSSPSIDVLV